MNVQEQKKRAAILLRYQTDKPSKESKVYRTYATIARALKMPPSSVRKTCLESIEKK